MNPELQQIISEIDWESFGKVDQTCFCKCGVEYRSHNKAVRYKASFNTMGFARISKEPCPGCGEQVNNCRKVSSDPEKWTV